MLIVLPPSEGKARPARGAPMDLESLSFPGLTSARRRMLEALVDHCASDPVRASATLGLGPTQSAWVAGNAALPSSPAARADRVYTGVLYDALDAATLSSSARRRAASRVAITSALFGLVRPTDRIPAYRLSGDAALPGIGPVAAVWRSCLGPAARETLGSGLLVDLRSTAYAAFWRPEPELAARVATVRVLQERAGRRRVVSHFNKATKGLLVRSLLEDGDQPRTPGELLDVLSALGWDVELGPTTRSGTRLDVIVTEVSPAQR